MSMKKHIARLANTDQRCVVAYMQIPGRDDHALVIPTDTLPPRYEQAVMEVLESPEGQAEACLANVLHRRLLPDTGQNLLIALHERNHLQPVPVANVLMLPMPNMPFPLQQVLLNMGKSVGGVAPNQAAEVQKYNQHLANQQAASSESAHGIARNLLIEAELLEADARKKREDAYRYAPDLAPRTVSVVREVEETVELGERPTSRPTSNETDQVMEVDGKLNRIRTPRVTAKKVKA